MSKHRLLDFYASKSWAILEENLQEMYEIYKAAIERKALDKEFDPEAVSAKIGRPLDNTRTVTVRDRIAILPVTGPIMRYANIFTEISGATSIELLALEFNQAVNDPSINGIVLEINSPGGEVDGTSELAQMIFNARGTKPITAYVGNLGASAAYWLASACDEVVCADTASLGSIGVVGGVRTSKDKNLIEFVSSQSPNKRPDPLTQSGQAQFQAHVDALADVFIETVARNRGMTTEEVVNQGGAGGLKVGRHAVDAGLADRVSTLEGVISDLASDSTLILKNVSHTPVLDIQSVSTKGVQTMADEKKPDTEGAKLGAPPIDKAEIDKGIKEHVTAFFSKAFGSPEPPKVEAVDPKIEENSTAIKAAQAEAEAAKKEATEAKAQIILLQKDARVTRFAFTVAKWPGEPAKHVAMLEILSQTCEGGEESQMFKDYVTQNNAIAEQLKTAALFSEVGSSALAADSAQAEIEAKAVKMAADSDGKLTKQQAYDQIYANDAVLRARVNEEERRASN